PTISELFDPTPVVLPTWMIRPPLSQSPPPWTVTVLFDEALPEPINAVWVLVNSFPLESTRTEWPLDEGWKPNSKVLITVIEAELETTNEQLLASVTLPICTVEEFDHDEPEPLTTSLEGVAVALFAKTVTPPT